MQVILLQQRGIGESAMKKYLTCAYKVVLGKFIIVSFGHGIHKNLNR